MQRAFNELIYNGRIEKGLTLKQAAKALRVSRFILRRLEYGYWRASKKFISRAAELYGVDEEVLSLATQAYAAPITTKRRPFILSRFTGKKPPIILSAVFSFVFLALVIAASVIRANITYNNVSLYGDEYTTLYNYIVEQSENDDSLVCQYSASNGTVKCETVIGSIYQKNIINRIYINSEGDTYTIKTSMARDGCEDIAIKFADGAKCSVIMDFDGSMAGDLTVFMGDEVIADEAATQEYSKKILEAHAAAVVALNEFYKSIPISSDYLAIRSLECKVMGNILALTLPANLSLYVTPVACAVSVIALIYFVRRYNKNRASVNGEVAAAEAIAEEDSSSAIAMGEAVLVGAVMGEAVPADSSSSSSAEEAPALSDKRLRIKKMLSRADKLFPFLHENFLRVVGLILLAFGSSYLILAVASSFMLLGDISVETIDSLAPYFTMASSIAPIILFFTKISILISGDGKGYKTSVIQYGLLSLFFYGLITFSLEFISLANNIFYEFIKKYIPSNMFMGMFAYTLIAMFLFSKPRWANTKFKVGLWRSLSAFPLIYLIISIFLIPNISVPYYAAQLFYTGGFIPSFLAVGYLFIEFINKNMREKRLKGKNISFGRYKPLCLMSNLFAAIVIAVAIALDHLFALSGALGAASSGVSFTALIAIPLILFYQPRLEPRNMVADILYVIFYGISYSFSVVLLFASPLGLMAAFFVISVIFS